jgi:hypothetical protein
VQEDLLQNAFCTKQGHRKASPDEFIFQNADGGVRCGQLPLPGPKTAGGVAGHSEVELSGHAKDDGDTSAENGIVKDIQAHLRHSRPDTTANEYMQKLPESVQAMVGSVYAMLMKGGEIQPSDDLPQKAANASTVTRPKLLKNMVGTAGFEPTTSTV